MSVTIMHTDALIEDEWGDIVDSLLEALRMVRDADEDCKRDGLPSMPPAARAKINAAIAKAEGRK